MEWAEVLGLSQHRLERLADAYEGYAQVLDKGEEEGNDFVAASSLLLSAVCRCLSATDIGRITESFRRAARAYLQQDSPYSAALAVCAMDDGLSKEIYQRFGRESGRASLFPLVVASWVFPDPADRPDSGESARDNQRQSSMPTGRLQLPLRLYSEAVGELADADKKMGGRERFRYTRALLERSAERIRVAQNDRYHWERVMAPVLPMEPEILSLCMGHARSAMIRQVNVLGELREQQIDPIALAPLEVAWRLVGELREKRPKY